MRAILLFVASAAMGAPTVKWGNIPLSFEPNAGQASAEVRYLARGSSYSLYLAPGETVLAGAKGLPLRIGFAGASVSASIIGEERQASTSNYLVGKDPSKWHSAVPNYQRVRYSGVYPGVDLVYYGKDGTLEYDWIVSPDADPHQIRLRFENSVQLRIDEEGDLVVRADQSEYRHRQPAVYQELSGNRIPVTGSWILRGHEAGFRIGGYDRTKPLVIDPPLIYSTYHGGNGLDYAYAIAVDSIGNTYVTGGAGSTNFPTTAPFQNSLKGTEDVFVTKINPSGTAKLYSTYLGGGGPDEGHGIAVDVQGNAYITGSAGSIDFPTKGAIQGTQGGSGDAFVAKLNATGQALVYSTYLGGIGTDSGLAIAVDSAGNAYIVGSTFSANFPTKNPFQAAKGAQGRIRRKDQSKWNGPSVFDLPRRERSGRGQRDCRGRCR